MLRLREGRLQATSCERDRVERVREHRDASRFPRIHPRRDRPLSQRKLTSCARRVRLDVCARVREYRQQNKLQIDNCLLLYRLFCKCLNTLDYLDFRRFGIF